MAGKRRAVPYQYEPLVTPSKWQGDELRFSVRLTQILDDLYQKFSSLRTGSGSVSVTTADDANKLGGIEASKYALKTGTVANSNSLGGKAPEYYLSPRNLLDNSDFRNPVNQRNISSKDATFTGYTIDRWIVQNTGSLFTLDSNGLNLAAETSFKYIYQRLNNVTVGKTYTLAACLSDGTIGALAFTLTTTTGGFAWLKETKISDSLRIGVGHSANIPLFAALSNINDTAARIVWAALYEGTYTVETLPPYVPKGYAVELLECQRYCIVYETNSTFETVMAAGYADSSFVRFSIDLAVPMRISNPSISSDSGIVFGVRSNGKYTQVASVTVQKALGKKLYLQANGTFDSGHAACLVYYTDVDTKKRIAISADL